MGIEVNWACMIREMLERDYQDKKVGGKLGSDPIVSTVNITSVIN